MPVQKYIPGLLEINLRLTESALKALQAPNVVGLMIGSKFIRTTNTYRTVPINDVGRIPHEHLQKKETLKRPVSSLEGSITKLLTHVVSRDAQRRRMNHDAMSYSFSNKLSCLLLFSQYTRKVAAFVLLNA